MQEERPRIVPPRTRAQVILELVALLAVLASVAIVISCWDSLPERVPMHFGLAGNPDAYGPKGNILIPVVLTVGLYLALTMVQWIPPWRYNYPVRITAENAVVQYRLARTYVATLKAGLSLPLTLAVWMTVQVALGHRRGLGGWFVPTILLLAALPTVWCGYAAYRRRDSRRS